MYMYVYIYMCVCGNRYNKRLAVQFNILTSAGGARGTHWTGTNEDAGVYLWYQKGTPFWRTCAIGWNCCSSCCHSTFAASILQATQDSPGVDKLNSLLLLHKSQIPTVCSRCLTSVGCIVTRFRLSIKSWAGIFPYQEWRLKIQSSELSTFRM